MLQYKNSASGEDTVFYQCITELKSQLNTALIIENNSDNVADEETNQSQCFSTCKMAIPHGTCLATIYTQSTFWQKHKYKLKLPANNKTRNYNWSNIKQVLSFSILLYMQRYYVVNVFT